MSHAGASPLSKATRVSDALEPALMFPEQEAMALKKLAGFRAKTGQSPNIVWLLVDDMGWGDPGAYGGGAVVGAATPNMDELAAGGLKLTATYAQSTCTPTGLPSSQEGSRCAPGSYDLFWRGISLAVIPGLMKYRCRIY